MKPPPITEQEYYERRDDRQRRLAMNVDYQSARTAVIATQEVVGTPAGQRAILTATNLLARWSRTVDLAFPDADLALGTGDSGDGGRLHDKVHSWMERADPFGDFGFREPGPDALGLAIGPDSASVDASFAVWADGWSALGWRPARDSRPALQTDSSPYTPALLLAACIGVGQLFKEAVGQDPGDFVRGVRWSLWDHVRTSVDQARDQSEPQVPSIEDEDLGRLLQVGAGAVGSNVLYFLDLLGVSADVTLVDYDTVEVENLDRSLLFGWPDAVPTEMSKSEAAASLVTSPQLSVSDHDLAWGEYVSAELEQEPPFDIWLPLANEGGVRRSMAKQFPPVMVHGSTSSDWEVYLGRHIPLQDYCLHCRFPSSQAEPDYPCSTGKSATQQEASTSSREDPDPSLPFLSAAAAVLVVGELFKLGAPGYIEHPNYVCGNLHGSMDTLIALSRRPSDNCPTCRHAPEGRWAERIQGTRYGQLAIAQ